MQKANTMPRTKFYLTVEIDANVTDKTSDQDISRCLISEVLGNGKHADPNRVYIHNQNTLCLLDDKGRNILES